MRAMELEESLKLLQTIMNDKDDPIVAANVVFGCDWLNTVMEKFSAANSKIGGLAIPDVHKDLLREKMADKYGGDLIEGTSDFFDTIYTFGSVIRPIIIDGLKDQPIEIVENSMLGRFLDGKGEEVKALIKTYDGLLQVDVELRALFGYLQEKFPEGYEMGISHLNALNGVEEGDEQEAVDGESVEE